MDTALALLDEAGSEAPSIRGVAARLGVRPNTLYTYFPDRVALERAIVDRLLALADPGSLTGRRSWRERIEDYACALREVLLHRPGAVRLFFTAPMDGPTAGLVGERLLAIFVSIGLSPSESSRASYAVITQVLGWVTLAVADLPSEQMPEDELVAQRRQRLAGVDPDQLPLTVRTADVAATWNTETQFRWQLRKLLDGCAPT